MRRMEEIDKCIEENLLSLPTFMPGEKHTFKLLVEKEDIDEAVKVANENMIRGYGFLVHRLDVYVKTKKAMEDSEVIYTRILNVDFN